MISRQDEWTGSGALRVAACARRQIPPLLLLFRTFRDRRNVSVSLRWRVVLRGCRISRFVKEHQPNNPNVGILQREWRAYDTHVNGPPDRVTGQGRDQVLLYISRVKLQNCVTRFASFQIFLSNKKTAYVNRLKNSLIFVFIIWGIKFKHSVGSLLIK